MRLHVGASTSGTERMAAHEAVQGALRGAAAPAFALVLSTDRYDSSALAMALAAELGSVPWAGCCTAGVFAGGELLRQGVVVGVFSTRDASFGVGVGGLVSRDPRSAGREAIAAATAAVPRNPGCSRAIILLPDGLTGNVADVVRGAASEAGAGAVWAGGGAGDNLRYVRTAQFARGEALHDHVVAIVIETPRDASVGIRHGFHPYGPPTLVTRASGPAAIELEYEPAFEVYRRAAEVHGDHFDRESFASFAMNHPLGIPQGHGEFVIRDPLAVEADGGVRCVGEVPDGCLVRVMEADRQELVAAARLAATDARRAIGGHNGEGAGSGETGGAIVFDCVSRAMLLGSRFGGELRAIQESMGASIPMMGCLTFGEIGAPPSVAPQFLNKTAVVLAVPV